jgi:hypothetical protein
MLGRSGADGLAARQTWATRLFRRDQRRRWVRDSNPRNGCPFSGFQNRRIRPLCQPTRSRDAARPVDPKHTWYFGAGQGVGKIDLVDARRYIAMGILFRGMDGPAMAVANEAVQNALRTCLIREGYDVSQPKRHGETGVDILACRAGECLHIEVIGIQKDPSKQSRDFYEVFFRAISRLRDDAKKIVIALPERFADGLHQRANQYGPAWRRLGQAFNELEIWSVNHDEPSYRRASWLGWLESAKNGQIGQSCAGDADPDRDFWLTQAGLSLAHAYGDCEPDYADCMLREPNPDYAP